MNLKSRKGSADQKLEISIATSNDKLLGSIRREFHRIDEDATGRRRVFFNNAAGTLVLNRAIEAEAKARGDYFPNVGEPSWESKMNEKTIQEGREAVADFLNAPSPDCIVSGESATSLLYHLSYAISKEMSGSENIVTTEYEHYANLSPWLELERRGVAKEVRFARFNPADGILDIAQLEGMLDEKTKVVAISGVSNALGTKTPIAEIFNRAKQVGAYTVLDAVHATPHIPIDVQNLESDFVVFSAYKLFGRRGSFMFGRKELLENLHPYKVDVSPNYPPSKWEMGTRDQALFASISAVIDYLAWLGSEVEEQVSDRIGKYRGRVRMLKAAVSWIEKYERTLSEAMLNGTNDAPGLPAIGRVDLYGLKDLSRINLRSPTFSFNVKGVDPKRVAEHLWKKHSVVVFPDDFYSRALRTYNVPLAIRASLVHFNTVQEVNTFLTGLKDVVSHVS